MAKKIVTREGKTKGNVLTRKVQFEYPAPEAKEVCLVGEFNNWDIHANIMKKGEDGI
ncbi:MAG: hypothetical protein C4549_05980 [Deltaproteobacteria bacterium]|jgi:1,4-alpha-glucan branching enzyme|nr:MAG: hypothetical protein C4549_05980 [Deltaproteobacteria bacterium]